MWTDSNNWTRDSYITLVKASVKGRFNSLHWLQYITIESGLKISRPIVVLGKTLKRGSGTFALNPNGADGGARGLFQAMGNIQKALGFKPGAADYERCGGDFCELSCQEQIAYSAKYLEEWRVRYGIDKWNRAGDMYLCNFWPVGLKHKEEPGYVLINKIIKTGKYAGKEATAYRVNAGLDYAKKGSITVGDMTLAANKALSYGVYKTAEKSLVRLAQEALGVKADGILGPITGKSLFDATGQTALNALAWSVLASRL
jgi:hypothetical protein